ncbi:MAG: DUF2029 domain-containing protein [Thermoleophilia bacterium]|nr:DUF2029 domain-containing protein [Thermoleophilia bacterium]
MRTWLSYTRDRFEALPVSRQRLLVTMAFVMAQVLIWTVFLEILWYGNRNITDLPLYYNYAGRIAGGMLPYRDFALEYPPVGMMLLLLPRLISGPGYGAYVFWFQAELLAMSCGIVVMLSGMAWRQWQSVRKMAQVLALYSFFILALGSIVKLRYDLAAAFVMLACLAAFTSDRRRLAWLLIGVGIMTKVVPVLMAPVFLIVHFRRRQYREMLTGPVLALLVALLIALPFLLASPSGLATAFTYHVERPLQLESSWASPLLLLSVFVDFELKVMPSYGSHNVFSAGSDALATLSGPVTLALLVAGYLVFWRGSRAPRDESAGMLGGHDGAEQQRYRQSQVTLFSTLAIASFIFGGKVLSPQFMIWLLPLMPLIACRQRRLLLGLFTAILLITHWEFPTRYWGLYMMQTDMIIVVTLRNLLLGVMVFSLLAAGRRAAAPKKLRLTEVCADSR